VNTLLAIDPISPPLTEWLRTDMLHALAVHDIAGLYRNLRKLGYSQHHIGALTKQSQPEISTIAHGRQVSAYDLLARIAIGLDIPACLMGLSFGDCDNGCRIHPQAQLNQERYLAHLRRGGTPPD
jgi:transcriptional regulator with XRE-family HTH domain